MNIIKALGSSLVLTTATFIGAQGISPENKSEPPKPSTNITNKENTKTTFDIDKVKKLIVDLDNDSFNTVRNPAYTDLLKMPENLSLKDTLDFLTYLLDESPSSQSEEVRVRLGRVINKTLESLEKTAASQARSPQKGEIALRLIETMDKKRSVHVWRKLTPVVVNILTEEAIINRRHYGKNSVGLYLGIKPDPQAIESLSKLFLDTYEHNTQSTKELQKEAIDSIISLTKYPLHEQEIFMSFHTMKLKSLANLPENKLDEIGKGLKELQNLYSQINFDYIWWRKLAPLARPHLNEILELNVDAYSTGDPKKQLIAVNNINILKDQFSFNQNMPQVKDLVNPKNVLSLFKQEFSKNITSAKELRSLIGLTRLTSELSDNNINYYKSYVNWIEKQIDNPIVQKLSDKKEIQDILESALMEELYTLAKSGYKTDLQSEVIRPLVKAYTKLTKQSNSDPDFLRKNLGTIIDFQYFSHFYLDPPGQEKLHSDILDLFDMVTGNINNVQNAKDKASLRMEVASAIPYVSPKGHKDYVDRLSNFYCKEQDGVNTEEFMKLTDSLLNSPDSVHPGKWLPPDMMLQFIESNPKYFEKNIQHIIETYKKSNVPNVKSASKKQLQELYLSFHHLFSAGHKDKAEIGLGSLTQYYQRTRVVSTAISSSTNLQYRSDWREQISSIEDWFHQSSLERQISEISFSKEPAKAGS